MAVQTRLITAEELEHMPQPEGHVELVRGEIITISPAGHEHGGVAANLIIRLGGLVLQHRLGRVYSFETGFVLSRKPDTVRARCSLCDRRARGTAETPRRVFRWRT